MVKFDGEFIIYWLLKNGFKHVQKQNEIENNTFTTLISNMGQFYNIIVYFKKGNKTVHKVTFIDSLKIIPFPVEDIAKNFGLDICKLEIDYNKPREINHILTNDEKEYIKNDVLIVAKALNIFFSEDLEKMTIASNAITDYKKIVGKGRFEHCFPILNKELDERIKKGLQRRFYFFKSYL